MAKFKMIVRGRVEAFGYKFEHNKVTEVRDDDTAVLQKLRGRGGKPHPAFQEVYD